MSARSSGAAASVGSRLFASAGQGPKNTQSSKKPTSPPPSTASKGPSASPQTPPPQQTANVSGATEGYKVKEYFEHNPYSFYDIHADMSKMRMPQPSSRK